MAPKRAPFIVVEGLDRSGKTTQTSILHSHLKDEGTEAKLMKFPDRTTPIGKMIDSYLKSNSDLDDHVIHLLFSANRWELSSTIEELLNSGTPIICDRYAFSGIAFSASKVVGSDSYSDSEPRHPPGLPTPASARPVLLPPPATPKLPFEWCRAPEIGLPAPDLVLFLDIAPEQAKLRGGYGDERYEKEAMQARVRKLFKQIGEDMQLEKGNDSMTVVTKWVVVDAGREKEVVAEEMWSIVKPLVDGGLEGPVGRLWSERLP